ncbi:unnamed protein product [Peniophora sp. CBMAI 1063]|nr:unnamed protein product [Peniophora sp. CBMAI 1063]
MSNFDDLLNPRSLEDNPFADSNPFAQPTTHDDDPWASSAPWGSASSIPSHDSHGGGFDEFNHHAFADVPAREREEMMEEVDDEEEVVKTPVAAPRELEVEPAVDPLDAPSANIPEEEPTPAPVPAPRTPTPPAPAKAETPLSPGFREVTSSPPPTNDEEEEKAKKDEEEVVIGAAEEEERRRAEEKGKAPGRAEDSPPTRPVSPPSPLESTTPKDLSVPAKDEEDGAPPSARMPHRQTPPLPAHPPTPSQSQTLDPPSQSQSSSSVFSPLDGAGAPVAPFKGLSLGGSNDAGIGGWDDPFARPYQPAVQTPVSAQAEEEEDDDDDKPLRPRPIEKTTSETSLSGSTDDVAALQNGVSERKDQPPVFQITVSDPQKVGDPIRGYTMYTVHTKTSSPLFAKPSFSVLRRYSDFLWLYETLVANNPGVVVPPVPEKNTFGRFDEEFVQARRRGLESCVCKMANHEVLSRDKDLKLFLESDTFSLDIKHRKAEVANSQGGVLSSISSTLAGPRFVENDEWFDRQKMHLDTLETQLRGLIKAIDFVARQRSELAAQNALFAQTLTDLSTSDIGASLSHSIGALAEIEARAEKLEAAQASADATSIMAVAEEYVRLIGSVRMAFNARIRVYHAWQAAEQEARRVHREHERNRAAGRIAQDRIPHALNLVADADRRAHEAQTHFQSVSLLVKREAGRFERERVADFRAGLEKLLDGMIVRTRERIAMREQVQGVLLSKVERVGNGGGGQGQQVVGNVM